MADEKLMTAWIEFATRGESDVIQKAKILQSALASALPSKYVVNVSLDISGIGRQVDAAIREIDRLKRAAGDVGYRTRRQHSAENVRRAAESEASQAARTDLARYTGGATSAEYFGGSPSTSPSGAIGPYRGVQFHQGRATTYLGGPAGSGGAGGGATGGGGSSAGGGATGGGGGMPGTGGGSAAGFWSTFFDEMSKGSSIRRAFARGLSEAFGDSMVASAVAGFGGTIAASLLMPLIWKLGDLMLGAVGTGFGQREAGAKFSAMSRGPSEAADWENVRAQGVWYYAASPAGSDPYVKSMKQMQRFGMSPADASQPLDWIQAISQYEGSDAEKMSESYARAMRSTGPAVGDIKSVIESSWLVEEAIRNAAGPNSSFNRGSEDQRALAVRNAAAQGKISRQTLTEAMRVAGYKALPSLEASSDTGGFSETDNPTESRTWRRAWNTFATAIGRPVEYATTEYHNKAREMPGFQGPTPSGKFQFGAEQVGVPSYHFSSVSGLADQMQMMMSQQVDVGPSMLKELKDINRKTPEDQPIHPKNWKEWAMGPQG